jgi:hypothetical protein
MIHRKGITVYSENQMIPINTLTVWQTVKAMNYEAGGRNTAVTTVQNKHVTEKNRKCTR